MIRVQAARPAGQRRPVTVRKTTISTPPAVSRQAATEIADRPAVRLSRLPVRPPVPHKSPEITRYSRPVSDRRRAAAGSVVNERIRKRSCDGKGMVRKRGAPNSSSGEQALVLTGNEKRAPAKRVGRARAIAPLGAGRRGDRETPVHDEHAIPAGRDHSVPGADSGGAGGRADPRGSGSRLLRCWVSRSSGPPPRRPSSSQDRAIPTANKM